MRIDATLADELRRFCTAVHHSERGTVESLLRRFFKGLTSDEERLQFLTPIKLPLLGEALDRLAIVQELDQERCFRVHAEAAELERSAAMVAPGLQEVARHKRAIAWLFIFDQLRAEALAASGPERAELSASAEQALIASIAANLPYVRKDRVRTLNVGSAFSLLGQLAVEASFATDSFPRGPTYDRSGEPPSAEGVRKYAERWAEMQQKVVQLPAELGGEQLRARLRLLAMASLELVSWALDPSSQVAGTGNPAPPVEHDYLFQIQRDSDLVFIRTFPDPEFAGQWERLCRTAEDPSERRKRIRRAFDRRFAWERSRAQEQMEQRDESDLATASEWVRRGELPPNAK